MNDRILGNKFSTILGILFIVFSGVLFFTPTEIELSFFQVALIAIFGVLLIFSKDTLINIIKNKVK